MPGTAQQPWERALALKLSLLEVGRDGWRYQRESQKLWADRDVVIKAVALKGHSLAYASDRLRADREVVLAAVTENGGALIFASHDLRADREVVLKAVTSDSQALLSAAEDLLWDDELWVRAKPSLSGAVIFRVSRLSGRACCYVCTDGEESPFGATREGLLEYCARHWSIGHNVNPEQFELLLHGEPLPLQARLLDLGLPRGEVIDIQFLSI